MGVDLVLLPRAAFRGQAIAGARLAGLLALLADDLHTGCSTQRLVEGLWPDAQPEHPTRALQVLVSRARALLGPDVIASTPAGYRLALHAGQVDAAAVLDCAAAAARCAQADDHAGALAQAETGLALWDGAPDGGRAAAADPLSELRAARAATHRALQRGRALALCRLGRSDEAVDTLADLNRAQPQDEEVLAQLLLHEAGTAGPSAALTRYDAYRRGLREQMGSDPGPELRRVHRRLLENGAPVVRRGVVHEPNALLGRDGDIAAVLELLRTSRVVSIIGPGGLGKTRLAHAVAGGAPQRAVHLVALAGVTLDADVADEVASALGVGERGPAPVGRRAVPTDAASGIAAALGPGPALLVLDNCEHVLHGAVRLVRDLVAHSGDLRVLTTSRAPLGLSSESVYPLPALNPETSAELFRQRANAARPGVELPEDAVRELCARLDGLPLTVELAAARVRVMSVGEIARRLADRFTLLRGAARDAPERHRTLHAVIDWSWNLLAPDGRAAMRALSVFPGGFSADAARTVLGGGEGDGAEHGDGGKGSGVDGGVGSSGDGGGGIDGWGGAGSAGGGDTGGDLLLTLDRLEQLVDQSLLQTVDAGSGTRFRMLETVREFSAARRREAGEDERVIGRFLGWARDFGVAHHESVLGPDVVTSAALTRDEQENLLLALRLGLDRGDGTSVAAVCAVLGALWMFEADFARMAALTEQSASALSHLRPEPAFVEVARTAAVLMTVSALILRHPAAARALVGLRHLPPAPPDSPARATAVVLTALAAAGDEPLATLQLLCDSGEPLLAAMANTVATFVWQSVNDLDSALKAARRTLAAIDGHAVGHGGGPGAGSGGEQQFPWFRVMTHSRIGELCLELGRGDEAHEHFAATLAALDALPGLNAFENGFSAARLRSAMVMANLQRGALDEAEHWLDTAERAGGEEGGLPLLHTAARAEILLARDQVEDGLRLWRQAVDALREPGRPSRAGDPFHMRIWQLEVDAMAVIAHALQGRLALVGQLAGGLPRAAARLVAEIVDGSPMSYADSPLVARMLVALAVLDLDRGQRTGDAHATGTGVRAIALAERFGFHSSLQPSLSAGRLRRLAEQADAAAYAEAVSAYAGLDADGLRAAASAAVRARDQFTGTRPCGTARPPRDIPAG